MRKLFRRENEKDHRFEECWAMVIDKPNLIFIFDASLLILPEKNVQFDQYTPSIDLVPYHRVKSLVVDESIDNSMYIP